MRCVANLILLSAVLILLSSCGIRKTGTRRVDSTSTIQHGISKDSTAIKSHDSSNTKKTSIPDYSNNPAEHKIYDSLGKANHTVYLPGSTTTRTVHIHDKQVVKTVYVDTGSTKTHIIYRTKTVTRNTTSVGKTMVWVGSVALLLAIIFYIVWHVSKAKQVSALTAATSAPKIQSTAKPPSTS